MDAQQTPYDPIAEDYATWVHVKLDDPASVYRIALDTLLAVIGPIDGLTVCDLGCGEGTVSRRLAERGAVVTGVDISAQLLTIAAAHTPSEAVRYVLDDAHTLSTLPDSTFDLVVSNLALMDIPDLIRLYTAVGRILRAGGRFVFSITHPCFQSPGTVAEVDSTGRFVARHITRYASEGFWRSEHPGSIRMQVGAYHRTLATVINTLIRADFALECLAEPTAPPQATPAAPSHGHDEIPPIMIIAARHI